MNKRRLLFIFISLIICIIIIVFVFVGINSTNNYTYNNPYIPKGFKVIERNINKGLVIEDKNGNQFVWVPVDNKKIVLSRKTFMDGIKTVKNEKSIDRFYYYSFF